MQEKATFNFDGQNLGILTIGRQPSELSKYFHVAEKTCILLSRSPPVAAKWAWRAATDV